MIAMVEDGVRSGGVRGSRVRGPQEGAERLGDVREDVVPVRRQLVFRQQETSLSSIPPLPIGSDACTEDTPRVVAIHSGAAGGWVLPS